MADDEARMRRLREAGRRSAAAADKELAGELDLIRQANAVDLVQLKLQLSDPEAYDKLIRAVQESTARNEDLAQMRSRVQKLGKNVVNVSKELARLLKP